MFPVIVLTFVIAMPVVPPVHQCVELGCVHVVDLDGDGVPDDARGGFAVSELLTLNFYHERNETWAASDVTTEETADPWHDVSVEVLANRTSREGGVWIYVLEGDEETGASRTLAERVVLVRDADGDGLPDADGLLP